MNTHRSPLLSRIAAGLLTLVPSAALAQFQFDSFANPGALSTVADAQIAGGVLSVTPAQGSSLGAAWFPSRQGVGAGFTTTFTFRLTGVANSGADGFAFVIQNVAPTAIGPGANGCRIGYDGLPNSVAVEFDTYFSTSCEAGFIGDPDDNHISVHTRGTLPNSVAESASIGVAPGLADFRTGQIHTVRVRYTPGVLEVFYDNLDTPVLTTPFDLAGALTLDNGGAFVGFTAATGGAWEAHEILSWSFQPGSVVNPGDAERPRPPVLIEPGATGQVLNPADVHMSAEPMVSPVNAGHLCSDWEIYSVAPFQRVWHATCAPGVLKVHIHLGDGTFENALAGRRELLGDSSYFVRVRYRDDSGAAASEYSPWSSRGFLTGGPAAIFPLLIDDALRFPAPSWTLDTGVRPPLPAGASLNLEGALPGEGLLSFVGGPQGETVSNPEPLIDHVPARVRVAAGPSGLTLGASTLRVTDHECIEYRIFLPPLNLAPAGEAYFWVSSSGGTYIGDAGQTAPSFAQPARGTLTPWEPRQAGYIVEPFASGLQLPVNIAFVRNPGPGPDDVFCYVSELYGQIMTITRSGQVSVYAGNLLNFSPTGDFPGSGELGLAGIAVDGNGDVYATILYNLPSGGLRPRVLRFTSTDGGRTAATRSTVIEFPGEPMGASHQISSISFGPDDRLYVHVGDGFDPATAQNLGSYRGKILRLNRNGLPPSDNPFYNLADGLSSRDYVWVYGLRNPFGGAWRQSDGAHYTVENGPSIDRLSRAVPGRNYGYDGSDNSMRIFAAYIWDPAHAPVNIAFIQQSVFAGSGFPAEKLDRAFVTESGPTYAEGPQNQGKRVVEFVISPAGDVVSGPITLAEYTGAGRATAVGLAAGPDGLYFTDLYKDLNAQSPIERGANILRIRYVGTGGGDCGMCMADYNEDGRLNPDDLSDFIGAYFSTPPGPRTDLNGDGFIDPDDLSDYIALFFAGC